MAEGEPEIEMGVMRREMSEMRKMMKVVLATVALPIPVDQGKGRLNQEENMCDNDPQLVEGYQPLAATNAINELKDQFDKFEKTLSKESTDEHVDVKKYCLFPNAKLPFDFKMPDIDKFDGTSDPKIHLRMYVGAMTPLGLDEECTAQLFQRTLTGAAAQWFSELEFEKLKTWDDIANIFVKQYSYNAQIKVTLRDLEVVRQGAKEGFADFVKRFRGVAARIINRPTEEDQMDMFLKNLHPCFYEHMYNFPLISFDQLYKTGLRVEDAMRKGLIKGSNGRFDKEVNALWSTPSGQRPTRRPKRNFDQLGINLQDVFHILEARGDLKPLKPKFEASPMQDGDYCNYHQVPGHFTENCDALRNKVQDLIEEGKVDPEELHAYHGKRLRMENEPK